MPPKELTLRGLVLGVLLTTVFTAANVYLGLKVGLTFASSIPAAVISMALEHGPGLVDFEVTFRPSRPPPGTLSAIIFAYRASSSSAGGPVSVLTSSSSASPVDSRRLHDPLRALVTTRSATRKAWRRRRS
jgi:hypothetical protein